MENLTRFKYKYVNFFKFISKNKFLRDRDSNQ